MLTFDPEIHQYRWNGAPVPGVTSILGDFIQVEIGGHRYHVNRHTGRAIESVVMEEAAAKGKDIHLACQLTVQGGLDWNVLDASYIAPVQQFEKWREQYKPQILYAEAAFFSQRFGYAGTIDLVAMIEKRLGIIDIKTGDSPSVGPQTAAYERGWCEDNRYLGATERWALWIPKDGSPFKFEKLTNRLDWDYFRSCLFTHNYRKGGK